MRKSNNVHCLLHEASINVIVSILFKDKFWRRFTKELTRLFASLLLLHQSNSFFHFPQCLGAQSTHFLWRCELAIEQLESWYWAKKLLATLNKNATNTAGIFKMSITFLSIPSCCLPVNKIFFLKMFGFPKLSCDIPERYTAMEYFVQGLYIMHYCFVELAIWNFWWYQNST